MDSLMKVSEGALSVKSNIFQKILNHTFGIYSNNVFLSLEKLHALSQFLSPSTAEMSLSAFCDEVENNPRAKKLSLFIAQTLFRLSPDFVALDHLLGSLCVGYDVFSAPRLIPSELHPLGWFVVLILISDTDWEVARVACYVASPLNISVSPNSPRKSNSPIRKYISNYFSSRLTTVVQSELSFLVLASLGTRFIFFTVDTH